MPSDPVRNGLTVTADATRSSLDVSAVHSKAVVYQSQGYSTDTDSPARNYANGVALGRRLEWHIRLV